MVYCYQKKNSVGEVEATPHVRDHFVREMSHASFILTAQIKLKELKGAEICYKTSKQIVDSSISSKLFFY
jgi:hypothetical protein